MEGDPEDLILIRDLRPGLFPQDRISDLRDDAPQETATNRSVPMACGPNVDQARPARGGSGAPHRGPWLARRPRRLPPTSEPRLAIALLGGALAGSGPGTSPYVGAVPGHRHGGPQRPARSNPAHDHGLSSVWSRTPSAVWSSATRTGSAGRADQAWRRDHLVCKVSAAARHPRSGSRGCRRSSLLEGCNLTLSDESDEEVCAGARWLCRVRPGQRPASRGTQTTSCYPWNLGTSARLAWRRGTALSTSEAKGTDNRPAGCPKRLHHISRSSDLGRA